MMTMTKPSFKQKKIEQEIAGLTDDDTTEVEITNQLSAPSKPYWQQVFG
jgi:hypothetical protein